MGGGHGGLDSRRVVGMVGGEWWLVVGDGKKKQYIYFSDITPR